MLPAAFRLFLAVLLLSAVRPLAAQEGVHPLIKIQDVYPVNEVALKVSAMCFLSDDLYMTVFSPDRQNKAPFKEGEVFRVRA